MASTLSSNIYTSLFHLNFDTFEQLINYWKMSFSVNEGVESRTVVWLIIPMAEHICTSYYL